MNESQSDTLLERLRRAGLSRYEAAVYLGLVQDQTARVAEISRRTGVPQPKVYQALDSLVEKGFCTLGSDVVNRYRPVEPKLALEGRLAQLEEEDRSVRALALELERLFERSEKRSWAPPIEIVKGLPQIRRVLVERIQEARSEILYLGQAPQVPALEVAKALWDRSQAGVSMRMIFEEGYFEQGDERDEEDDLLLALKAEKRWAQALPTKLIVVDRSVALLSISKPGSVGFLLLVFRQAGLVGHCLASFEHYWESARAG